MTFVHKKQAIALLAFALTCPQLAGAQSLDQPFAEGFELNPIEPTPAGDHFYLVPDGFSDPDDAENVPSLRAKLFLNYALSPTLIRTDNQTGESSNVVKNQLYSHANLSYYLLPWLMVNADLPLALYQNGEGASAPKSALGDLRLGARFGLVGKRSSAFAFSPGIDLWMPTGSPTNLTGDTTVRSEPYLSLSGQLSFFVYAAKVGFLFRHPVNSGSLEVGNSMTFGAASGVSLFKGRLQVGPELSGRTLVSSESDLAFSGIVSPTTAALGARFQLGDFNLGGAYGLALTEAPGSAPRLMFGFSYSPASVGTSSTHATSGRAEVDAVVRMPDEDGDGVADSADACPKVMGDPSQNPALNGCPDVSGGSNSEPLPPCSPTPAEIPRDTDGDGISDAEDVCPNDAAEPGQTNGCPSAGADVATPQAVVVAPVPRSGKGTTTATWVGFRKLGPNSALLYVNLTQSIPVKTHVRGNVMTYTLSGTHIGIRNNSNPLLAEHFGSAVKSARLVSDGPDLQLVIELNGKVSSESRMVPDGQGATFEVELRQER